MIVMRYSRNKINIAGKLLVEKNPANLLQWSEAKTVIDNWREDHLPVLANLIVQVNALFEAGDVHFAFSSQRLKRMTSIIAKLNHNPGMCLGGLQDIGGARFVFDDTQSLFQASKLVSEANFDGFELDRHPYDYVQSPKSSGYRSIHFVFKYHSEDESLDGKRVELQLRTKLQHSWATAVETAELISKSALKAGVGNVAWQEFFQLVSAVFAKKENLPVSEDFVQYTEKDYCVAYARMDSEHRFVDRLRALVGTISVVESQTFERGYVVLLVDTQQKNVHYRHFAETDKATANELYSELERNIQGTDSAALLVSVIDMQELLSAYPSYFMNAKEFIDSLAEFVGKCKLEGYIA